MSSYVFVEHSWLTALLIYFIYKSWGFLGLSVIWTVVVLAAFYLSVNTSETKFFKRVPFGPFSNFLIIFIYISTLSFFAVRVQIFSWFFLTLFLYLYFNENLWKKYKYFTPAIFLLWVNMHGSFIAGISVFFLLTLVKTFNIRFPKKISIKEFKKVLFGLNPSPNISDILVFLLCGLVTFINPYGLEVWRKTSKVVSSNELMWEIQEWLPKPLIMSFSEGFYLTISVFLVFKKRLKIASQRLYLYLTFLIQGLMSARHFPLYLLVSLPITFDALYYLYKDIKNIKFAKKRFFTALKFLSLFTIFMLVVKIFISPESFFGSNESSFYPQDAINFLRDDVPQGEIFSIYGWGGYLNWKLPEKRVFINGFMPLWSREKAPSNESLNAYRDYTDILKDKLDYEKVFDNYNVEVVLLPVEKEKLFVDRLSLKISNFFSSLLNKEKGESFLARLEDDCWSVIYKDTTAMILKKNE